jgi:choline-sulfatase
MATDGLGDRVPPTPTSLAQPPNILLIVADQLSAPCLPAYGNRVAKSPNVDRLSRHGVVFESAYCNFPQSGPSVMALISGQLPSRVEAFDNGSEVRDSLFV